MPELIWEGKYDNEGRKVAPLKVALPFQTIETVNESAQERQRSFDLFGAGQRPEWRNRLIWGDKKYVLPALVQDLAGEIKLIYIDPPFATGQDFSLPVLVADVEFLKEPSMMEVKAYRDTWGVSPEDRVRGVTSLDRYLRWFYETTVQLRELLAEDGSLYVHLDWHVVHYVKAVLDEIFGLEAFRNEVAWCYTSPGRNTERFKPCHDTLLYYAKTDHPIWTNPQQPLAEATLKVRSLQWKGQDKVWTRTRETKDMVDWWEITFHTGSGERLGFPTQKPEALIERILTASSRPDDLVADFFVGSGTTAAVAEKMGRRWIAADLSRFAIHTTRKRLLSIEGVRPFVVQNLGKYERQVWQAAEFGEVAEERTRGYRLFILDLYRAKAVDGYVWLHGVKGGRMVHVGSVDSPVTVADVRQIAAEFRRAVGSGPSAPSRNGVDVLGWDFAFELNEVAKQEAARAKIDVRFLRIPREVLDKRAGEQGDVQFFELAALSVGIFQRGRDVTVELTDFVIPVDDVPAEIQGVIKHWSQWVDYWAVDWENKGDTFHNEWQTYRTRNNPKLNLSATHRYEVPGAYQIVVKVIDILGNDTTKTLDIEVP